MATYCPVAPVTAINLFALAIEYGRYRQSDSTDRVGENTRGKQECQLLATATPGALFVLIPVALVCYPGPTIADSPMNMTLAQDPGCCQWAICPWAGVERPYRDA